MHILLIDVREHLLADLHRGLQAEGFVVELASGTEEGNVKAHSSSFDVIILDLTLPGINGLPLLQEWRRSGLKSDVLILTAEDSVWDTVHGLNQGADHCLTRPFAWEELLARLRALRRRRLQARSSPLRIADLEINPDTRKVTRSDKSIALTPREFSLLQFLASHRGTAVTRSQIREHMYSQIEESSSNVVDVYIRYLRNKIDKGFKPPLILTIWGVGYLLRGESSTSSMGVA